MLIIFESKHIAGVIKLGVSSNWQSQEEGEFLFFVCVCSMLIEVLHPCLTPALAGPHLYHDHHPGTQVLFTFW